MNPGTYLWHRKSSRARGARLGVVMLAPALSVVTLGMPPVGRSHPVGPISARGASPTTRDYIVRGATSAEAARAVTMAGGRVVSSLPLIEAVDAGLSTGAAKVLMSRPGLNVTPNLVMRALGNSYGTPAKSRSAAFERTAADVTSAQSGPAVEDAQLARMDLAGLWSPSGGSGVGVALIDTGVRPSPEISPGHLVFGPDFSGGDSTSDRYGHGTFMAGLIAGNGTGGTGAVPGVAPGATLVSVKVADASGKTSLSQVIQGIGWAVAHKDQYDIRVMSISFGADLPVSPAANPLDAAVEAAWAAGITVVAAAGNYGPGVVTSPGDDPWVVTVGGETTTGAYSVPSWSGSAGSKPDVLAPGVSVVSLRDPGSTVDEANPQARVGSSYFVGSGTSMATALTAGAAALIIRDHPDATPDDVKAALTSTEGQPLVGHAGPIDVLAADHATASSRWRQSHALALRGTGPNEPQSMPWAGRPWTPATWATSLPSASLTAVTWPHLGWDTVSWETVSWETLLWETVSWETVSWEAVSWEAESWAR